MMTNSTTTARPEMAASGTHEFPRVLDPDHLEAYLYRLVGTDARLIRIEALGRGSDQSVKAFGYGTPIRIEFTSGGRSESVVVHTQRSNVFGHDRRADRVASAVLALDTFNRVPRHVRALDAGLVAPDGTLRSMMTGEPFVVTCFAEGRLYAEDVRAMSERMHATSLDLARARLLAEYVAELHRERVTADQYRRSIRDAVGHGEGIFGLVDSYPSDDPVATPARLRTIEHRAVEWRWRLKSADRGRRTHGDFHPYNILFDDEGRLSLLDASRGCVGDPADDVTCLSINYLFFSLLKEHGFCGALREVWSCFWRTYLERSGDTGVLDVVAPYFAWRALVLASPVWYPGTEDWVRHGLLSFAERLLDGEQFDPERIEEVLP